MLPQKWLPCSLASCLPPASKQYFVVTFKHFFSRKKHLISHLMWIALSLNVGINQSYSISQSKEFSYPLCLHNAAFCTAYAWNTLHKWRLDCFFQFRYFVTCPFLTFEKKMQEYTHTLGKQLPVVSFWLKGTFKHWKLFLVSGLGARNPTVVMQGERRKNPK